MTHRNLNYLSYLSPRYWLLWLGLGLAFLVAWLPLRVQLCLGYCLGILVWAIAAKRRRYAHINIAYCFPERSLAARRKLVRQCFASNGMGLIEGLRAWFRNPASLQSRTSMHGLHHLEAALASGKGVILLGGHFSTLDIAGGLTTLYFKADVLQRDHSNPLFNAFMTRSRLKHYGEVLGRFDLRGMIRCLRNNDVVWYATDQDFGRRQTVFAPFFGQPCATLTTPMRLAQKTGAVVLPFSHFRRSLGKGYDIYIHPPLDDFPGGDVVHDAARLNQVLEREIRRAPAQYLWMHRRFKTPVSPGERNIYGQLR